ncbi:MAG: hypothetical protein ACUVQ0_02680 [Thermoproteota archaeon]
MVIKSVVNGIRYSASLKRNIPPTIAAATISMPILSLSRDCKARYVYLWNI